MDDTNGCTEPSKPRRLIRPAATSPVSSVASTSSERSTTSNVPTKPSTRRRRPPGTALPLAKCLRSFPPSTTRPTTRSASSVATEEFAGTASGSTSLTPWEASTSASKKSTMTSGTYTSVPSDSAASMKGLSESRTTWEELKDGQKCYPCPRTNLLPISPAVQELPRTWVDIL